MLKLKNIISHLETGFYETIENELVKTKAENFLFLLRAYRLNTDDSEIVKKLELNSNSFHALKSRLYDKIQNHLSASINITKEELIKKIDGLPQMCFNEPREIVIPFLEKIESDLKKHDMHSELLSVYSAFKKVNLYSDKYFYYSQLYNKHVAFCLSIEKSEEILGNFNNLLGQYFFSKSNALIDALLFNKKEILNQIALNPSKQIEIIKNIMDVQLYLFCNITNTTEINVEEVLKSTRKIIEELPDSSIYKYWNTAIDYLAFEYFFKEGKIQQAEVFFNKVDSKLQSLLLYSNICFVAHFLISKIEFAQKTNRIKEFCDSDDSEIYTEVNDKYAMVCYALYNAMKLYYKGRVQEAANILQQIVNENNFRDYFHISAEIKFTLALFYMELTMYDPAMNVLKSIYRKIKYNKALNYSNALSLIKFLETDIDNNSGTLTKKQKDDFVLFIARNKNETELLKHFVFELDKKYS